MGAFRWFTHIPLLRSVDSLHEVILPCLFFISWTFCSARDEMTRAFTVEFTLPLLCPGPSMDLPLLLRVLLAFCASFNAASAASHCEYIHLRLTSNFTHAALHTHLVFLLFFCSSLVPFLALSLVHNTHLRKAENVALLLRLFPLTSKWIGLDGKCSW